MLLLKKNIEKFNKPGWSKQRQFDPPWFGNAKLLSQSHFEADVLKRVDKCTEIIKEYDSLHCFERGLVSMVILSCKRLDCLKRFLNSFIPFINNIETYKKFEAVLVDNGSGDALVDYAKGLEFFSEVIAFEKNLGMTGALRQVYPKIKGEYILFVEDDFVFEYEKPFLKDCIQVFDEYPEIGIIRLKDQNNWWKPFRRISPLRKTSEGSEFWTWLPSKGRLPFTGGKLNVWAAGSVIFRKISYLDTGDLSLGPNFGRNRRKHQGALYETEYGKRYNKTWLAAKMKNCQPFYQPNDEEVCPGWGEL